MFEEKLNDVERGVLGGARKRCNGESITRPIRICTIVQKPSDEDLILRFDSLPISKRLEMYNGA